MKRKKGRAAFERLSESHKDEIAELVITSMPSMAPFANNLLSDAEMWGSRTMFGKRDGAGKLIACCGLCAENWLSWFAVHPDHQRRGLGTKMLHLLFQICKHDMLYVETYLRKEFAKANAFYLSNGFEFHGFVLPDIIYYKITIKH